MQFGGHGHFGGCGQFGGVCGRGLEYYRILKGMRPPGAYSDDDESVSCRHYKAFASGLGDYSQAQLDALRREVFPQLAEDCIGDWERLLGVVPAANAPLEERRAAVVAAWRGGIGSSGPELRQILAPLLNPSTAFRDTFDSASVGRRWVQEARSGVIGQALGQLIMAIGQATSADWLGGSIACPTVRVPLVDRDDAVTVSAELVSGGGARAGGGLALWQSPADAYLFYRYFDVDGMWLQVDAIVGGVLERPVYRSVALEVPFWMQIELLPNAVTFRAGATPATVATVHTMAPRTIRPRDVCLFLRNSGGNAEGASIAFGEVCFSHGRPENNVEIVRMKVADVPAENPSLIFSSFVHREPTDPGSYDIAEAQRRLDKAKFGPALILVGESDCFRAGDPYSLVGRDILGG